MKVERVSYDAITPSAARGIFEAIYWKPQMRWTVTQIDVLKPIKWINLRRNEVGAIAHPPRGELSGGGGGKEVLGIFIEDVRQQRAGLFLRDVAYRLRAEITNPRGGRLESAVYGKCAEMFRRRARVGQCFHQPYLGCREFAADFSLVENPAQAEKKERALAHSVDLGYMLYDLDYADGMKPMFFRAEMKNGVIDVPSPDNRARVMGR